MNILILNGSPRKNGNTVRLIQAFAKGAEEAGHTVAIETVALQDIHGCKACEYCHAKEMGVCVQQDDMQALYPKIAGADMLVLASPIYYYTMTAHLQATLQWTYALGRLTHVKKAELILSSGAPDMYGAVARQYQGVIDWWGQKMQGFLVFLVWFVPTN